MEKSTEFKILIVLVILSFFFPIRILLIHFNLLSGNSGGSQNMEISGASSSGGGSPGQDSLRASIAAKRLEAIKAARAKGETEYRYSLKVPPPPISGGN